MSGAKDGMMAIGVLAGEISMNAAASSKHQRPRQAFANVRDVERTTLRAQKAAYQIMIDPETAWARVCMSGARTAYTPRSSLRRTAPAVSGTVPVPLLHLESVRLQPSLGTPSSRMVQAL